MAFKKKLPMSAALRQGGEGTVKPRTNESKGGSGLFGLEKGSSKPFGATGKPPGGTKIGGGVSMNQANKAPTAPSLPNIKVGPKMPKMPSIKIK